MATIDLQSELDNGAIRMDERLERKVVSAVLKLLQDKVALVQNEAIKCLGALAPRVSLVLLEEILTQLMTNAVASGEEELRDLSCIVLKGIVDTTDPLTQASGVVCRAMTDRLMTALADPECAIIIDALELTGALLERLPQNMSPEHARIEATLLPILQHARPVVRKRAVAVLGRLLGGIDSASFDLLVRNVTGAFADAPDESRASTMAATLQAFAREGGASVRQTSRATSTQSGRPPPHRAPGRRSCGARTRGGETSATQTLTRARTNGACGGGAVVRTTTRSAWRETHLGWHLGRRARAPRTTTTTSRPPAALRPRG